MIDSDNKPLYQNHAIVFIEMLESQAIVSVIEVLTKYRP